MQRFVDNVIAIWKESVKTITYEALNNIVRFINGVAALFLTILPGKANILETIHGWELRPTFRGPRFPRWMENGVSSFNQLIHELSVDSDNSSLDNSSADEDSDVDSCPASPLSHSSRVSRQSNSVKFNRRGGTGWIRRTCSWILYPAKIFLAIPFLLFRLLFAGRPRNNSIPGSPRPSRISSIKKVNSHKDHIVHRATDRRRGIIEDLHLATEIYIETIFNGLHRAAHFILSPSELYRTLHRWFTSHNNCSIDLDAPQSESTVPSATLGEDEAAPTERTTTYNQFMNTDSRTCQDVITELGYPYEAIRVVTSDGYVLLLERIPRRDSRKVVYLQHGILDSSMGWVSNGIVGSPAFAAYDQGYDVYLGNLRGLVSREHVDKNISSRKYWRYSLNEHGTEDIPAMIEKIHQVKTSEFKLKHPGEGEEIEEQPYKLCAICHSLGCAAMLMYVITSRIQEKPHRLSRLILLSPAGFHHDSNIVFTLVEYIVTILSPILEHFVPAFYIPTRFFRMLLNKLARDFYNYPAVGGLVQTLMSFFAGGDSSNWVGVLGLPHYNMNDMPGVAFRVALHLAQIKRTGKFRMYDYGSTSANMEVYGSPEPLDLGECYGFIDVPVDLVAGRKDQVIRPSMVRKHYKLMKESDVDVSYNEFEYAHLDFTFSHHEELLAYVMSRLLLVDPNSQRQPSQKALRLKKKGQVIELPDYK